MSQQINLLAKERLAVSSLLVALGVWLLVIVILLFVWSINLFRLAAMREMEAVAQKELVDARAIIKQREDQQAALLAQIEMIRPRAEAAQTMLDLVDRLGNSKGYAGHFVRIADISEEGLWLSKIDIEKAGRSIRVEGQSLNKEAIMRFSRGMNDAFVDQGLKFSALEIKPSVEASAKQAGVSLTSTPFVIR